MFSSLDHRKLRMKLQSDLIDHGIGTTRQENGTPPEPRHLRQRSAGLLRTTNEPLEVITVGVPRTGTASILEAMKILGYGDIWNAREMLRNHQTGFCGNMLHNKLTASGKQPEVEQFESLFRGFRHISGEFVSCMAADLIRAYPEAKVILTVREDEERWLRSVLETLWYNYSTWSHWLLRKIDRQWREMATFLSPFYERFWGGDSAVHGLRVYREHKAMVQRVTEPKDRLLVCDVKQGWGPLCGVLEKDVPAEVFPKTNSVDEYSVLFSTARRNALQSWVGCTIRKGGLPVMLVAVLVMYRSKVISSLHAALTKVGLV
ncbi:hypothetical protein CLAFUW4_09668 [Fulvia fulva]|uniref:Uncharacterized protein n=1 Tax=Passalora fulva TaxID=5499 RepID=A0A9Q8UT87_PASFU|nr:uncharacterized protein CLAFUR5_09762 [Fulvia fulva]KAK4614255.1 hypothetical protein CLAFUR4_09673 [Fulvia fulva]KAK4614705.1 hypothetical protein CLAFUR0_09664 [Fulvia fulva]UJO21611.1 hypothetical protein CLAFUR5_09762 [Fulvia fulva]WPV20569.1 hypothetical protein CLAFUW4_09668 [Fulvia fulva]WPV35192.1 hypothetical protein CLAFUW7_09669 [Fulvia fulva]